jgi:hypothetical protein
MEPAVEGGELEAGALDRRDRVPSRAATAERARPEERVDGVLEAAKDGVARADVLVEAQFAARDEHAPKLTERGGGVGDAAEHPDDDGDVDGSFICRQ